MDVFTEFRRGKTIENRELEPYTPSGNYPGHPGMHRSRYVSSCIMSPFITRPVSFNNVMPLVRRTPLSFCFSPPKVPCRQKYLAAARSSGDSVDLLPEVVDEAGVIRHGDRTCDLEKSASDYFLARSTSQHYLWQQTTRGHLKSLFPAHPP